MENQEILQTILGELRSINGRLDSMENHMNSMENRMNSMENRMDSMENRIGSVEATQRKILNTVDTIEEAVLNNTKQIMHLDRKIDGIGRVLVTITENTDAVITEKLAK